MCGPCVSGAQKPYVRRNTQAPHGLQRLAPVLDLAGQMGFSPAMTDTLALKKAAAARALDFVDEGMKLGLGSGTTAEAFLELLGARVAGGLKIVGAPTSERAAARARAFGIALGDLDELAPLDLTVDGADEADDALDLIKGGGAALLREKIVASSSRRMVVIADESKLVRRLGRFPLPVEVTPFGHATTAARIADALTALGYGRVPLSLRLKDGAPLKTDSGNVIYDCALGAIAGTAALASALSQVTGVVGHGLFVGLASTLVIAGADGVKIIERTGSTAPG
jgi:ribose 5-phosphate isomerase A